MFDFAVRKSRPNIIAGIFTDFVCLANCQNQKRILAWSVFSLQLLQQPFPRSHFTRMAQALICRALLSLAC